MDVTTLYEAARNAGLLTAVTVAGSTVHCAFRAPDETVLDGFALSRDYQIDYPASWLTLAVGDCRRAFKSDHLCALNFDQG